MAVILTCAHQVFFLTWHDVSADVTHLGGATLGCWPQEFPNRMGPWLSMEAPLAPQDHFPGKLPAVQSCPRICS
jgi:hypothetical protein